VSPAASAAPLPQVVTRLGDLRVRHQQLRALAKEAQRRLRRVFVLYIALLGQHAGNIAAMRRNLAQQAFAQVPPAPGRSPRVPVALSVLTIGNPNWSHAERLDRLTVTLAARVIRAW
jgi:hypothetical protein